ncbi:MAG TPA: hypothetical protein VHX15_01520 [Frankiaceae bacterium]|nr:hypothetical protein [Frankiaceae bacterium]
MGRSVLSKLAGICAGLGAAAAIAVPIACTSAGVVSARGSSWAAPQLALSQLGR